MMCILIQRKQYTATVEKQLEYDIHIEKQVDFTLEN